LEVVKAAKEADSAKAEVDSFTKEQLDIEDEITYVQ